MTHLKRNPILLLIVILMILGVTGGYLFFKKHVRSFHTSVPVQQAGQSSQITPTSVPVIPNITVTSPGTGETVQLPMIITGQGRVFENQLSYRILDDKGTTLSSGNTMTNSPDAGQFGAYTITIQNLGSFDHGPMSIEVFQNSAKDGSEIDKVIIPVTLQ